MKSVKTKVGDRYVVEEMLKNGYNPGKQSGHIFWITMTGTACCRFTIVAGGDQCKSLELADVVTYPQS